MEIDSTHAALQISADLVESGQSLRLRVNGNSMEPLLYSEDWVIVVQASLETLNCGDLIVLRRESDLVTHRLVKKDAQGWLTKGDSLPYLDPEDQERIILGRVIAIERDGHRMNLESGRWKFVNETLGRLGWFEAKFFRLLQSIKPPSNRNAPARLSLLMRFFFTWPFQAARRILFAWAA